MGIEEGNSAGPASESFPMSQLCMRWPKYWSFSFKISPTNEQAGLISFRMDWLDLLAVQGTLKSLLQHHSSKASILWRSEKEMATHSSILAWKVPQTEEPGSPHGVPKSRTRLSNFTLTSMRPSWFCTALFLGLDWTPVSSDLQFNSYQCRERFQD